MKKELIEIKKYIIRNYKSIIFLLILGILTYSIRIFNYSISIDSEVTLNNTKANDLAWISTGRWFLVYLGKIIHLGNFNPFYSNLLMIPFLILGIVLNSYTLSSTTSDQKKEKVILPIIGAITITSPILCEMLSFTMMSVEVSIGYLITAIATLFLYNAIYKKKKNFYSLSLILLICLMGLYQAFYSLFISEIVIIFIYEKIFKSKNRKFLDDLKIILIIIIEFVLAFILSSIITKILMHYFNLTTSTYLSSQIMWGKDNTMSIIKQIIYSIKEILLSKNKSIWTYSYIIMIFLTLIYFIKSIKENLSKSISIIIYLIFAISTPFIFIIIMGRVTTIRTMLNYPIVLSMLLVLYILKFDKKFIKNFIFIIVILTSIIQFKQTYDLLFVDYKRYENDKNITYNIFNKIEELNYNKNKQIIFIGYIKYNSNIKSDTLGYSFYEWDALTQIGINYRINQFAKTFGFDYKLCNEIEYKEAKKISKNMESYPSKNSIKETDKYIIIKLS